MKDITITDLLLLRHILPRRPPTKKDINSILSSIARRYPILLLCLLSCSHNSGRHKPSLDLTDDTMKISPASTKVVALLAVLGVNNVYSFSPSISRRLNTSPSALASTTVDAKDVATPSKPLAQQTSVAAVPKIAQRWRKRTKQLATLGPASSTFEMIETLFLAGADVFRLNFSHGSQEQKKELLTMIREVEEKYSHPIAVLGDLQGPKLRVSTSFSFKIISNNEKRR